LIKSLSRSSLRATGKGKGLGLSLSYDIIRAVVERPAAHIFKKAFATCRSPHFYDFISCAI